MHSNPSQLSKQLEKDIYGSWQHNSLSSAVNGIKEECS